MANNCLYSLPCLKSRNDVCHNLKQNLYYGRAIKKKPVLGNNTTRVWWEATSVRALKHSTVSSHSPSYFSLPTSREEAAGEDRKFPECMHVWVPLPFQTGSLLVSRYGNN